MDFFGDADAYAEMGSAYGECSGGGVWGVGQLLSYGQDFFAGGVADSGAAVEGAVYGADGDSGQLGDFVDSGALHGVPSLRDSVILQLSPDLRPGLSHSAA